MAKHKAQKYLAVALTLFLSASFAFPFQSRAQEQGSTAAQPSTPAQSSSAPILPGSDLSSLSVNQLNNAIADQQNQQKDIQNRLQQYQDLLAQQQKSSASLQNELTLLDTQVQKAQLDQQSLDFSVEEKRLELESSRRAILDKQQAMDTQQSYLDDLVRTINRYDQQDPLEELVTHNSFSEIVSDIRSTSTIENQVTSALTNLQKAKNNLELEQADQERRKRELETLQQQVQQAVQLLNDQQTYKQNLLQQTQSSESQYGALLDQARQDQSNADSQIKQLQQVVDLKLNAGNSNSSSELNTIFTGNKNVKLAWPVSPLKGISAYFHDPTYIYAKWIGQHSGIDIPTPQGTPILAPADGIAYAYCSPRTLQAPCTNTDPKTYSYIVLAHTTTLMTVYGHASQINIANGAFVKKGQVIGLTGALPGTPGAGPFTTGAHLHFEVRLNGIPVNPLDYLP